MVSSSALCAASVLLFSSLSFASPAHIVKRATISPDGTCGGAKGYTCQGSNYGNSCGKYNLCGRDTGYSEISNGCQPAYGFCYAPGSVSPDGTCGGTNMFICIGSNYGNSCGRNNKCGSDAGYSGAGLVGACLVIATLSSCATQMPTSIRILPALYYHRPTKYHHLYHKRDAIDNRRDCDCFNNLHCQHGNVDSHVSLDPPCLSLCFPRLTISPISTTNPVTFQKRAATSYAVLPLPLTTSPVTTAAAVTARNLEARATGAGLSCGSVISTGFTTTTTTKTLTFTATTTSTTTATSLTTVPAATTTIGVAGPIYSKAYERTDTNTCFYSGSYYQQVGVSNE